MWVFGEMRVFVLILILSSFYGCSYSINLLNDNLLLASSELRPSTHSVSKTEGVSFFSKDGIDLVRVG